MKSHLMRKLAEKSWIGVVILAVAGAAGVADYKLHGMFASDRMYADGGPPLDEPRDLHPKHVLLEIFGSGNTRIDINYLDQYANPQRTVVHSTPWSISFDMTKESGMLNLFAQSDSDYLGCRIKVDDEEKDTYVAQVPFAHVYCQSRSQ